MPDMDPLGLYVQVVFVFNRFVGFTGSWDFSIKHSPESL